jgi:hypothetical protein
LLSNRITRIQIASPHRECAGPAQEYCAGSRPSLRSIFQFESKIRSARILAAVLLSQPKSPMGWKMDGTSVFFDPQELGRRQQLAAARRRREGERLALLAELVDAQKRVDELKNWINAYTRPSNDSSHPDLQPMVEWATAQIKDLELFLSPERISATLPDCVETPSMLCFLC